MRAVNFIQYEKHIVNLIRIFQQMAVCYGRCCTEPPDISLASSAEISLLVFFELPNLMCSFQTCKGLVLVNSNISFRANSLLIMIMQGWLSLFYNHISYNIL